MGQWLLIEPEYEDLLRKAGLADLDALLRGGGGRRLRHSLRSNVYRVQLPQAEGRTLYIKSYREPWPRLRYLLRRSRAAKEWRVLRGLAGRGIPAARPVAVGERRRWGALLDAVLVTEEVPGTTDLETYAETFFARPPSRQRLQEKRRAVEALARFTRSMHRAGYLSRDFHWRNILIAADSGQPRFFVIDNPRGLFLPSGRLTRWLAAGDLAALDLPAPHYLTRTDRLRFLKVYAGAARLRDCRGLLERLLRRERPRSRRRAAARPSARTAPAGPLRVHRAGRSWLVFREQAEPTLHALGALEPTALLRNNPKGEEVARVGAVRTLRLPPTQGRLGLRLKRAEGPRGLGGWLRRLAERGWGLGYGPCGREWRNLRALAALGLGVPRWLAFAQERRWGLPHREALLVEEVAGAKPLRRWLAEGAGPRQRRAFLRELGRGVARAHAGGFAFGGFSPEGIWVRSRSAGAGADGSPEGGPEPVFVDPAGGRLRRRMRRRDRIRDLARLAHGLDGLFSRTDAMRFFRAYLGRRPTAEDKTLARAVLSGYRKLQKRNAAETPAGG